MDNTNLAAKVTLREHFLGQLPRPAQVLECFAGENRHLFKECYTHDIVTSLDLKPAKDAIRVDNRRFIASYDITAFNYFDLDAYGSPYELLLNIFYRKSEAQVTQPFAVICTDGMARNLGYGKGSKLIQTVINNKTQISIPCLNRHHEFIIKLILKTFTQKYNLDCIDCKIIREQANSMFYYGGLFQLSKQKPL